MKNLIKQLLREGLMFEAEVFDYTLNPTSDEISIRYSFETDGMIYLVGIRKISMDPNIHSLDFYVKGQEYDTVVNKGVTHAYSVLATIDAIMHDAAKKFGVEQINFIGIKNERELGNEKPSVRTEMYLRYLNKHHPNAKITPTDDGHVIVDLRTIWPELYPEPKPKEQSEDELSNPQKIKTLVSLFKNARLPNDPPLNVESRPVGENGYLMRTTPIKDTIYEIIFTDVFNTIRTLTSDGYAIDSETYKNFNELSKVLNNMLNLD
jgi:hypothetical protein